MNVEWNASCICIHPEHILDDFVQSDLGQQKNTSCHLKRSSLLFPMRADVHLETSKEQLIGVVARLDEMTKALSESKTLRQAMTVV